MDQLDASAPNPAHGLSLGAVDRRTLARFVSNFALLFGLLCLPMLVVGPSYARACCALGNALLPDPATAERLTFRFDVAPNPQYRSDNLPWKAVLAVQELRTQARVELPLETGSLIYLPVAAFLALALATPVRDRRRKILIWGGLPIILALSLLLAALSVVVILNDLSPIRILRAGPWLLSVLSTAFRALMTPGMTYAVPAMLWWMLVRLTRPTSARHHEREMLNRDARGRPERPC